MGFLKSSSFNKEYEVFYSSISSEVLLLLIPKDPPHLSLYVEPTSSYVVELSGLYSQ